jgi:hypothetical protein
MRRLVLVIDWGKGKGTSSGARAGWLVSRVGTEQGRAALSLFAAPATSIHQKKFRILCSSLLLPQVKPSGSDRIWILFFKLMLLLLQYLLML